MNLSQRQVEIVGTHGESDFRLRRSSKLAQGVPRDVGAELCLLTIV